MSRPNLHGFSQEHDKGCLIRQTSRLSIEALKLLDKLVQDFFARVAKQHHSMCSFLKKKTQQNKKPPTKKKTKLFQLNLEHQNQPEANTDHRKL